MCRYLSYLGAPLPLADLVYKPKNSLVHQAAEAMESRTRINADGFGIGWYNLATHPEPAVFKDLSPVWNNANLRSMASKIAPSCVLAHIRAARRFDPVNRANCHPFQSGNLLWMHNGDIPGRGRLHKRVCHQAADSLVARIAGNTDSELAFVLFLSLLEGPLVRQFETDELRRALRRTIEKLLEWWRSDKEPAPIVLNFCVSNGTSIVASRFALGETDVPSLHYCVGSRYSCENGVSRMTGRPGHRASAIVSSERLSEDPHWATVDNGKVAVVDGGPSVTMDDLTDLL